MKKMLCVAACIFVLCAMMPLQVLAVETVQVFDITGLSLPVDGGTPDFSAGIVQSDCCKVVSVQWMDLWTDSWMGSGDRFKKETDSDGNVHQYRVVITVELLEGNMAGSDPWYVTVNGQGTSDSGYEFTYYAMNNERTMIGIEGDYTPAAHSCSGGYATCIAPAKCSTCGKEYGNPNPENHDVSGSPKNKNDSKYTTHHDVTCDLCKKVIKEEAHSWGPLNQDNVRPCTVCWYTPVAENAEHTCSGGKATCAEPAYCSTCNKPYGEVDPNAHTYLETYGYVDEVGHAKNCTSCGKTSEIEPHVSSADDKNRCDICGSGFEPVEESQGATPKNLTRTLIITGGSVAGGGTVAVAGYFLVKKLILKV